MKRNLYCGISRVACNGICGKCCVRFKCYTIAEFEPLLVTVPEWYEVQDKQIIQKDGVIYISTTCPDCKSYYTRECGEDGES